MTQPKPYLPGQDGPLCAACRHVTRMGGLDGFGWACAAFPVEIPPTIVLNVDDHRKPYPGDNGTQFAEAEGED
jgi:hypothetical protein